MLIQDLGDMNAENEEKSRTIIHKNTTFRRSPNMGYLPLWPLQLFHYVDEEYKLCRRYLRASPAVASHLASHFTYFSF